MTRAETLRYAALAVLAVVSLVAVGGGAWPSGSSPLELSLALLPPFCLLLGFGVAARRPDDPRAWLLLMVLLSFGTLTSRGIPPIGWPQALRLPALGFHALLRGSWGVWMLLFGIYFPERSIVDRRLPWLKWLLVGPVALYGVLGAAVAVLAARGAAAATPLTAALAPFELPARILTMACIGGFFALLGHKSGTLPSPDSRRRIRLMWTGASVGLTPMFLIALAALGRGRDVGGSVPAYLLAPALLALAVFPLTLAYVIVVERALDVGGVIRQGLQYALARQGVRALQIAVGTAVILAAVSLAADPEANRPLRIRAMAGGIALVFLVRVAAERLGGWVDRRFFAEAVDAEKVVAELGDDVRTIVDVEELLGTVARRLSNALHVPRVAALVPRGDDFVVEVAQGTGESPGVHVPANGELVRRLKEAGRPLLVYPGDPHHWASGLAERAALEALASQLLIPLLVKQRLLGVLSLGPKLSEQAYAPSDQRLLGSVGAQIALALDNAQLTATVAADVARRERLNREIEIAREVQERLFPQSLPRIERLDYAGHCRPARGVGGDYYDFLALPDGRLGLAIGDVSGKGIPAALLMASLQASLRGQAAYGSGDLAQLMARINRLICDASSDNRYATFFYAELDPKHSTLRYVNAGHNAPMLLRAAGAVERLDVGGPVVGLIDLSAYEAASVSVAAGDRLIAYTDGVSEAMSTSDEEWGEERLLACFRTTAGLTAAQALERVLAEADAFAAGAPQHDDLTLLVAHWRD